MKVQKKDLHAFIGNFIINFTDIDISFDTVDKLVPEKIVDMFYDADIPVPNNRKSEILRKYILPNFNYENKPYDDTSLVIHIRSGDIMKGGCHGFYVQPPFSFYKKVIEENSYSNIIIVTEPDKQNPAIELLQNSYSNVTIQCTNLYEDVSSILNAKNLICNSHGTFGHMLSLMSPNIKNLYMPYYLNAKTTSFYDNSFLKSEDIKVFFDMTNINHFKVHEYFIFNYISPFGWNPCDNHQIELLKTLHIDYVFKVK